MAHERLTLDNSIFAQTLRHTSRSVPAYQPRPMHPQTAQDMMFVRSRPMASVAHVQSPGRAKPIGAVDSVHAAPRRATANPSRSNPISQHIVRDTSELTRKSHKKRALKPMAVLYVLAAMLFVAGVFVTISSLRTDEHVKAQVKQLQATTSANADNDTPTDEKPSDTAVNNYSVAPNLARYLDIPKLSVHARVIPLGVKTNGTLKAPGNGYDVGWYNASSRPGENGAMLIDGHSNVLGKRAVFAKLGNLVAGDELKITRGDGQVFAYHVRSVEIVDNDKVDMASLLVSADTAKPGLNLITCAGDVIPGTLHLDKRALVKAVLE